MRLKQPLLLYCHPHLHAVDPVTLADEALATDHWRYNHNISLERNLQINTVSGSYGRLIRSQRIYKLIQRQQPCYHTRRPGLITHFVRKPTDY